MWFYQNCNSELYRLALLAVIRLNINLIGKLWLQRISWNQPPNHPKYHHPRAGYLFLPKQPTFSAQNCYCQDRTTRYYKNRQFCAFLAFFKIVGPFCHNDVLELWKRFHILFPILPLNSPCSGRNFKSKQCTFGLMSSSYSQSQPGVSTLTLQTVSNVLEML